MKSSAQTREHDPLTEEEQDDEHVHELRYRRPFDVLVPRQSHHPSHVMVESPFVFFTDGSVLYYAGIRRHQIWGEGGHFVPEFKAQIYFLVFFMQKKICMSGKAEGRRSLG